MVITIQQTAYGVALNHLRKSDPLLRLNAIIVLSALIHQPGYES